MVPAMTEFDRMKLYDGGRAPNPRRVQIFLAEKGVVIPTVQVDINRFDQKTEYFSRQGYVPGELEEDSGFNDLAEIM